jgi:hypothetical protein
MLPIPWGPAIGVERQRNGDGGNMPKVVEGGVVYRAKKSDGADVERIELDNVAKRSSVQSGDVGVLYLKDVPKAGAFRKDESIEYADSNHNNDTRLVITGVSGALKYSIRVD